MTQQKIKFVAVDMDGTLLNENGELPKDFFSVFEQLKHNNILFAAASGRQYYSLRDTFEKVQDEMLFIAENGTFVMHKGEELYSATMPKQEIVEIVNAVRAIPNAYLVLCGKRSAYIETQDPVALEEIQHYYHRCEYVEDVLSIEDDFIKVAVCHFGGTEELVYPTLAPKFAQTHQVVISGRIWLDLMNICASKGDAIKQLQNRFDFTEQQTMSFGDYLNDIEMLKVSYYSYAMRTPTQR
ncbi:hydrolase [Vibrio ishigakensis]|uniref:Hydrolase n=1 Tax=Vibrio ishigakensis TaxID=1481914 RepID=A0A0B8NRR1_9VIBR|nr:hydrolase [Vibrio ishigakensis]